MSSPNRTEEALARVVVVDVVAVVVAMEMSIAIANRNAKSETSLTHWSQRTRRAAAVGQTPSLTASAATTSAAAAVGSRLSPRRHPFH